MPSLGLSGGIFYLILSQNYQLLLFNNHMTKQCFKDESFMLIFY